MKINGSLQVRRILTKFITLNGFFKPSDPEYRQVCFNNAVLLLMALIFSIFTVINTVVTLMPTVALVDFVGFIVAIGLYGRFYKTKHYVSTANGTVGLLMMILIAYLTARGHRSYALIWTATLPLLAYFLLGWKKGMAISLIFYAVIGLSGVFQIPSWQAPGFDLNVGLNVVLSSVSLLVAVTYYEFTRQSAYDALAASQKALEKLHVTDQLTQVNNRIALDRYFAQQLDVVKALEGPLGHLGILLIDVDHFKHVNDTYGHITGDHVLFEIARVLSENCRMHDLIGRWGGEEFLIICPNTEVKALKDIAERLRLTVSCHVFEGVSLPISISLGLTTYVKGDTVEAMMRRADLALYRAKDAGRNQWVYH